MPDPEHTLRFIRRLAGMRGFLAHLLAYLAVSLASFAMGTGDQAVPLMVGWGVGLLMHGLAALGPGQFLSSRADARIVERLCRRQNTGR